LEIWKAAHTILLRFSQPAFPKRRLRASLASRDHLQSSAQSKVFPARRLRSVPLSIQADVFERMIATVQRACDFEIRQQTEEVENGSSARSTSTV
jgi:hypothetical protein